MTDTKVKHNGRGCDFNSWKTAKGRRGMSVPMKWLMNKGKLHGKILDHGCGRGQDVRSLQAAFPESRIEGYDPLFTPYDSTVYGKFDTVTSIYVLNALPQEQGMIVLRDIRRLVDFYGDVYMAVREDIEEEGTTSRGTHQRRVWPLVETRWKWKSIRSIKRYTVYHLPARAMFDEWYSGLDNARMLMHLINYSSGSHKEFAETIIMAGVSDEYKTVVRTFKKSLMHLGTKKVGIDGRNESAVQLCRLLRYKGVEEIEPLHLGRDSEGDIPYQPQASVVAEYFLEFTRMLTEKTLPKNDLRAFCTHIFRDHPTLQQSYVRFVINVISELSKVCPLAQAFNDKVVKLMKEHQIYLPLI